MQYCAAMGLACGGIAALKHAAGNRAFQEAFEAAEDVADQVELLRKQAEETANLGQPSSSRDGCGTTTGPPPESRAGALPCATQGQGTSSSAKELGGQVETRRRQERLRRFDTRGEIEVESAGWVGCGPMQTGGLRPYPCQAGLRGWEEVCGREEFLIWGGGPPL